MASGLLKLVQTADSVACSEEAVCLNGPRYGGQSWCLSCRFAQGKPGGLSYWTYVGKDNTPHPQIATDRRQKQKDRLQASADKRKARDPHKRSLLKRAAHAEKKTEAGIIHATQNSGRVHMDGDHIHGGQITLDTKLQTKSENPIVHLAELDKVRADSVRAGTRLGALVLHNKFGRQVVVIDAGDYARLVRDVLEN